MARVISAVPLLRYRVPLLLIYASGLRVRECVSLTVNDIDGPGNRLFSTSSPHDRHLPKRSKGKIFDQPPTEANAALSPHGKTAQIALRKSA